jgi:O-methyltransferase involved in polyketide biosynthesis
MRADRASMTARLIAAATVMCQHVPQLRPLVPQGAAEYCRQFLATSRSDRFLRWSVQARLLVRFWGFIESIAAPGIVSHWMRRKQTIEQQVRTWHAQGATQLIVLGAGLDTLAFRLADEDMFDRVISVDHPATLSVIRQAQQMIRQESSTPHPSSRSEHKQTPVELLPLDLSETHLGESLRHTLQSSFSRSTIIVIEGVLMYLPGSKVTELFQTLASFPWPRAQLLASWMMEQPGQPIGFRGESRFVSRWLKRQSEPMLWATTPAQISEIMQQTGWSSPQCIDLGTHLNHHTANIPVLHGEHLAIAEKATSTLA